MPGKEPLVVAPGQDPQVPVGVVGPVGGEGDGGVEDLDAAGPHVPGEARGFLEHAGQRHDLLDLRLTWSQKAVLVWSHLVTDLRVQLAARGGELVLELDEEERRLGGVYAQAPLARRWRSLHVLIRTLTSQLPPLTCHLHL